MIKENDEPRNIHVNFMVSKTEKEIIDKICKQTDTTISNLIRKGLKYVIENAGD